jgi:hypothetical protein
MSTLDLGVAERAPDVRSQTNTVAGAAISRPAPLNESDAADDSFYVGSVKIEPLPQPHGTAEGVTA